MEEPVKYKLHIGAIGLASALAAYPAMAQTASTHSTTAAPAATAPATGRTGDTASTTARDRNPVMTADGMARSSKVVGSSVYNDHDEKVGSIDDLLIGKDGKLMAVLSVGG